MAATPLDGIARIVADQRIGCRRADDVVDVGVGVPSRKSAIANARLQIDGYAIFRKVIFDPVIAPAAINRIGTGGSMDRVVAIAGHDTIACRMQRQVNHGNAVGRVDRDLLSVVDYIRNGQICRRIQRYELSRTRLNARKRKFDMVLGQIGRFGKRISQLKLELVGRFGMRVDRVGQIACSIRTDQGSIKDREARR